MSKVDPGAEATVSRTILEEDLEAFARLSLDRNRLHFDDDFAEGTFFGRRVAHGMLGAALISGALTLLMGDGNAWLSASLRYEKPILVGDELTCRLKVQEVSRRGVADISVSIHNQRGESILAGTVQSMRFVGTSRQGRSTDAN